MYEFVNILLHDKEIEKLFELYGNDIKSIEYYHKP